MNIIKNYMTNSPLYKAGTTIKPKGAFIHSVGCPQPKASVFINTMNKASARTGVAAFIEPNGNVYQTLPINFSKKTAIKNWHAGSGKKGSANAQWIGVELTEPNTIKYTGGASFKDLNPEKTKEHVANTYKYAVEYFAYLCEGFGWDPLKDGVILSHNEGYKRGYATGHSDVEHIWSKYGYTMDQFRKDIKEKMKKNKESAKKDTSTTKKVTKHYQVIATDGLNIREGAAVTKKKVGHYVFSKCFTISKISANGNWGYISNKGWVNISSKYVKEIERVEIICSSLNVRNKASILGKKVGSVKKGEKHYVSRTSGNNWGWLAAKGWANISSKYVKKI